MYGACNLDTDGMGRGIRRHDEGARIQPMTPTAQLAPAQCLKRSGFAEQAAEFAGDGVCDRMAIDSLKTMQHKLLDAQDAGGGIGRSGAAVHR
jgi:hypothetical protein